MTITEFKPVQFVCSTKTITIWPFGHSVELPAGSVFEIVSVSRPYEDNGVYINLRGINIDPTLLPQGYVFSLGDPNNHAALDLITDEHVLSMYILGL